MRIKLITFYALVSLRASLGSGYTQSDGNKNLPFSSFGVPGINQTFDYVIVGGGTSGLTVAARLAANAEISVAVIEAGGSYEIGGGNFTQIPAYEEYYASAPAAIDWEIYTTPQPQLLGRSIHYSQGKCLGGSSGRNGMAYQRGTNGSYQAWADAVNDQSYTFGNLLPYFQRSVNFTPPNYARRGGPTVEYQSSAYSPTGGPLRVSYWNYYIPVSQFFRQGLLRLGFVENGGIENGSLLGFAQYPATLDADAQIRDSSQTSFLQESMLSTGLQVYQGTLAKRIIFDGKAATGVSVSTNGVDYSLSARREVVLAAGPFRSPQLLMVSGIGPQAALQELGIPIIANLSGVGQNIWDQPGFGVAFSVNVTTQFPLFTDPSYAAAAQEVFLANQSGPLTAFGSNYLAWEHLPESNLANLTASARTDLASYPSDWPDLQYILSGIGLITNDTPNNAAVGVVLMKSTSRGNVTINSTDTADNPVVNVNWLATTTDQQLAVQGLRRARDLSRSFDISTGPELLPGPAVQTDAEIWAYIQASVGPSHHAVGSCKMGVASDPSAVVDSKGRVLGDVFKLRIVDASVMPLLPPGQPMATVYMLAEKLAAGILQEYL